MVTKFGMSEKLGPIALEGSGGRPLYGIGFEAEEHSEKLSALIDAEVSRIVNEAMEHAAAVVKKHRKALDAIAARLMEKETMEREEFEQLLVVHGIAPKQKKDIEHQL
jgi:cell division protease FtsH